MRFRWPIPARVTALGATLSLLLLRRPRRPAAPLGAGAYWLALLLLAVLATGDDWLASEAPRRFDAGGFTGLAFQAVLALGAGLLLARAGAARPRVAWLAAGIALLVPALSEFLLRPIEYRLLPFLVEWPEELLGSVMDGLWVLWVMLAFSRLLQWLAPDRGLGTRLATALFATLVSVGPRYYVPLGHVLVSQEQESEDTGEDDEQAEPDPEPTFDAEEVLRAQDQMLGDAIAQLAPQRPDRVDLYLIAFGGDGAENVFRNEVEYADRLFRERFEGEGRTLVLLNHPATVTRHPLATLGNLERALAAIGRIADREQDIVALYVTSHGSEGHEVYVNMPPLPLRQIKPDAVRAALDAGGVRHRVVLVSACYAGGFMPALKSPETMLLTAARADRPSFGCGSDSEITYFGRALLVDALNRTTAFDEAFRIAEREIAEWESARDEEHSYPQFASTPAIDARLARWREQLRLGLPVRFEVAEPPADPLR